MPLSIETLKPRYLCKVQLKMRNTIRIKKIIIITILVILIKKKRNHLKIIIMEILLKVIFKPHNFTNNISRNSKK